MVKHEQIKKVFELKNMAKVEATKMLEVHGEYYCMIDGIRTKVVKS